MLTLAKATSLLILVAFALVNLALLRLKRRIPAVEGVRSYPRWVSAAGLISTLGLIAFQLGAWVAGS